MSDTLRLNRKLYLWPVFSFFFTFLVTFQLYSQKTEKYFEKADNYYQLEQYEKAIKFYLKIIDETEYNERACLQCARCYVKLEEYAIADALISQVFYKSESVDPEIFLEYGDLLMILGRNEEARSYYTSYNNMMEIHDLRVLRNIKSIEDIDKYYLDSAFIAIELLSLSSEGEDLNPRIYANKIYFESNIEYAGSEPKQRSIYAQVLSDKNSNKSKKISVSGESKQILKGFAIANSTGEIFMSVEIEKEGRKRFVLKHSFIDDDGMKFSMEDDVFIDSFEENIMYPAVNATGQILVFASDAKTGIGGLDLYISYRDTYGYGKPFSIQGFVNTTGNETHPYLVNDSILFFASDGHGGLGGLDIYSVNLNKTTSIPGNLGYPVNTQFDEFGLSLSPDNTIGYTSSNRSTEKSRSDIYKFELVQVRALGEVTDQNTGDNLKNVSVSYAKAGEEKSEITLADNGKFSLIGQPGDEYNLTIWSEGYEMEDFYVSTASASQIGLYEVNIGKFPILKIEGDYVPEPIIEQESEIEETIFVEELIKEEPPATTETVFRLQIAASRVPLSESELKGIYAGQRDIFMFEEEGWYKYAIGDFVSYFEANAIRKNCGVKGAFIAAYSENSKLVLMSAIKQLYSKEAELKSESVSLSESRERISNTTIYYPFDQCQPLTNEMQKIDELLDIINMNKQYLIEIDGHTDIQGSNAYNFGLSTARANYIKEYLISKGVDYKRIIILGYGENRVRRECNQDCTPAMHKENRRAEVLIYKD